MANSTLKQLFTQNARITFKNYVVMHRQLKGFYDEYVAADLSSEITSEEILFDGVTGAEFKAVVANIGTALTVFDGGVDTNIVNVIGTVSPAEQLTN